MAENKTVQTNSNITKNADTKIIPTGKLSLFPILGMPPEPLISSNQLYNSIPIVNIEPCTCIWADGLNLFQLQNAWEEYEAFLGMFGFSPGTKSYLQVAYIPDNLPTETFTNEFGQTFIAQMANVVGDAAGDLAQMSGGATAGQTAQSVIDMMKNAGGIIGGVGQGAQGVYNELRDLGTAMGQSKNKFIQRVPQVVNKLLGGQKVDFPQVWKNSTYAPTYGITVKLYCLDTSNDMHFERLIVGPLTALLALALPQGQAETYKYPFFCKVKSPGLFSLPAAGITSISVVKGGDGSLVGYNRRIGLVDIRIEFIDLFTTLLMQDTREKNANNDNRTNLKLYINQLRESRIVTPVYTDLGDRTISSAVQKTESELYPKTPSKEPVDTTTAPASRVDQNDKNISSSLLNNNPSV